MDEAPSAEAQEQQAYLALSRLRDVRDTLPDGHPAAPLLGEAIAVADAHWRDRRAVAEISRRMGVVPYQQREG